MAHTRIQLRHDTAALWMSENPVLFLGEYGYETDTRKHKVGDGTTAWNDLAYNQAPDPVSFGDITGVIADNAALLAAFANKQNAAEMGQPGGYAGLDASGKLLNANIPTNVERTGNKGQPNGYTGLDSLGRVAMSVIPSGVEKNLNKDQPNGYAGLDGDSLIQDAAIPDTVERAANKGQPNGYVPLDENRYIPPEFFPPGTGAGGGDEDDETDEGAGSGIIPRGVICMWSGRLMNIPQGWALCDGTKGTPNLTDRFILSVPDSDTNPGAKGGDHSVTLSTANIPSHNHGFTAQPHNHSIGSHQHTMASHSHSIPSHTHTTSNHSHSVSISIGSHTHGVNLTSGTNANVTLAISSTSKRWCQANSSGITATDVVTETRGHTHPVSGNTGSAGSGTYSGSTGYAGAETISGGAGSTGTGGTTTTNAATPSCGNATVTGTTGMYGEGQAFDIKPKYFTLAFIMKL